MTDDVLMRYETTARLMARARRLAAKRLRQYHAGKVTCDQWVKAELAAHAATRAYWAAERAFGRSILFPASSGT